MYLMHISRRRARQANMLGALALAAVDRLWTAVADDERSLSASAALIHLRLRPGQTIDFLARVLGISHPATVRLVDRFEVDGLVERRPGRDGRSRALVLTSAGRRAAAAVLANRRAVLDDLLAPLSAPERRQLEMLLEKLLDAVPVDRWAARHTCRLCDFPTCAHPSCPVDSAVDEQGLAIDLAAVS
jgi:MarR family transcriptional regulator, negative regulator of the multidrug operon emrRAB